MRMNIQAYCICNVATNNKYSKIKTFVGEGGGLRAMLKQKYSPQIIRGGTYVNCFDKTLQEDKPLFAFVGL